MKRTKALSPIKRIIAGFLASVLIVGAGQAADEKSKPEEQVKRDGSDLPDAEKRLAKGDLGKRAGALESCGAQALGIDPDLAAGERPGDYPLKNGFAVKFQDEVTTFSLMSTMILPGKTMKLETVLTGREAEFSATAEGGELEEISAGKWRWTAPDEKGFYCIKIREKDSDEVTCINAFVLVPYKGGDSINGYRIGKYESKPLKGLEAYKQPKGLIEVTAENLDTWISPHFQLRQFLCKQSGDYPKYLVLTPRLLQKLETLLDKLGEEGIEAHSFYVLSGFRTPYYNKSIGNTTTYSRHCYGDAADIFVDRNADGRIDDLNRDGKAGDKDAKWLYSFTEELGSEPWYKPFVGGLGLYETKPHRSAFIHVDARGTPARW